MYLICTLFMLSFHQLAAAAQCRNMWKAAHDPQCAGDMFMHLPRPYQNVPSMFCELTSAPATCNDLMAPGNLTHHVSLDGNCACPSGKPAVVVGHCIDMTGKWQLEYYGCDMGPLDPLAAAVDAAFEDTAATYANAYYEATSDAPQFEAAEAVALDAEAAVSSTLPDGTPYELVPMLSSDDRSVQGFDLHLPPRTVITVRLDSCSSEQRGALEVALDHHMLLQGADNAPTTMHMALEGVVVNYTYVPVQGSGKGGETLNIQTAFVNVSVVHALSCSLDVVTFERGEPHAVWAGDVLAAA